MLFSTGRAYALPGNEATVKWTRTQNGEAVARERIFGGGIIQLTGMICKQVPLKEVVRSVVPIEER
jgi:hypothetical protein